ncbi:MAG: DUF3667 domain-containing protein [Caulobacteraceae bacterium]
MSGELEAAGALATAGAVAGAIEGREGGAPGEGACPNCGTPIVGPYCSQCGQHTRPIRKLTHVFSEFLHGLWHLDTKTWRTLPMVVFRPGTLTRNYVYGKRARHLSPLTMFLFSIFLMFFAFSTIDAPMNIRDGGQVTAEDVAEAREEVAQARAELERARTNPSPDEPAGLEAGLAEGAVSIAEAEVERLERQLAQQQERAAQEAAGETGQIPAPEANQTEPPSAPAEQAAGDTPPIQPAAETPSNEPRVETWQDGMREVARSDDFVIVEGNDNLNERIRRRFENPDLVLYQIQDAASKFSFLLAPLSLPFIALLFLWKRGVTLYDHMAYALYALAFAAILFSAVALLGQLPLIGWAAGWLLLALPVHMYFHLGGAYALGWWSALWRTFFMLNFAFIVALTFTILVVVLGLAGQ